MRKILNFILPSEEIINLINIHNYTHSFNFTYLISDIPQISADLLIIPFSEIDICKKYYNFIYTPFMVYGNVSFIEKSFIHGSCDYLKSPWTFNELETRAMRFLNNDKLCIDNMTITFSNHSISGDYITLPFTVNEYKILHTLANNMDKIISKESIYYRLEIRNTNSRVIDVYLNSIRKKISKIVPESGFKVIRTVRDKGYIINSQFSCG